MQHRLRDKGRNLFDREATMTRLVRHAVQSMLVLFLVPALVSAEVSRVEITSRRDAAGGRSFGSDRPIVPHPPKTFIASMRCNVDLGVKQLRLPSVNRTGTQSGQGGLMENWFEMYRTIVMPAH